MALLAALFSLSAAFTGSSASPHDSCTALIGSCDYYACVEVQRLSCGDHGYPIGYGVNYCEKLTALTFEPATGTIASLAFPGDGTEWRDNVRECLQVEMDRYFAEAGSSANCEELHAFAFDSHPRCYTELQPVSFCELPPADVLKVGFTIAPQDILTPESLIQIRDTAEICDRQLDKKLDSESNFLVRLELQKYRLIWKAVAKNPALMLLGDGGI